MSATYRDRADATRGLALRNRTYPNFENTERRETAQGFRVIR
jgi:hypothetical protein